jgi:hypothetical protein
MALFKKNALDLLIVLLGPSVKTGSKQNRNHNTWEK